MFENNLNLIYTFTFIKTFVCLPSELFIMLLPKSMHEDGLLKLKEKLNLQELPKEDIKKFMKICLAIRTDRLRYYLNYAVKNPNNISNQQISEEIDTELMRKTPLKFLWNKHFSKSAENKYNPIYFFTGALLGLFCLHKIPIPLKTGINGTYLCYFFGGYKPASKNE